MKKILLFGALLVALWFANALYAQDKPFITKWRGTKDQMLHIPIRGKDFKLVIKNASGTTLKEEASLTLEGSACYKYTPSEDGDLFIEAGPKGVERIQFMSPVASDGSSECLLTVEQFGDVAWTQMTQAFYRCTYLQFSPNVDIPDLSKVTNMEEMFWRCTTFNHDISGWDVSNVESMGGMFEHAEAFNQDLGKWKLKKCSYLGLQFCGMDVENYSKSLEGWAAQEDISENMNLAADNLHYYTLVKPQRTKLIKEKHWSIRGDMTEVKDYNLNIGGLQLTSDNILTFHEELSSIGVLKSGNIKVTLEKGMPILKFENIELADSRYIYMIASYRDDISSTFQLQGVNKILFDRYVSLLTRKGAIVGRNTGDKLLVQGNVWFNSSIRNCTLEVEKELGGNGKEIEIEDAIVKAQTVTDVILKLKNCIVLQPEGARYDESKKEVIDENGKLAQNVVIASRASSVTLTPMRKDLEVNAQLQLTATVLPDNTFNKELEWFSDKPQFASVDQNGLVTGNAVGTSVITVKTKDGGFTENCEVTVIPATAVEDAAFMSVVVKPNPFKDVLRISNETLLGKYILLNAQGIEVRRGELEMIESQINTADLPTGIYLLQLITEGGARKTYRIVKQ